MFISPLLFPTNRLHRAGVDRLLAVAGAAVIRAGHIGLFVDQLEYPGADFGAVAAPDAQFFIYDRSFQHHSPN